MLKSVFENIMQAKIKEKKELERKRKNIPFRTLVKEFIFSVPFTETIFIRIYFLI